MPSTHIRNVCGLVRCHNEGTAPCGRQRDIVYLVFFFFFETHSVYLEFYIRKSHRIVFFFTIIVIISILIMCVEGKGFKSGRAVVERDERKQ